MDRCCSVHPGQRPSLNLICENLHSIVQRAENAEDKQPAMAEQPAAPPRGYKRKARKDVSQLSEEMGDEVAVSASDRAARASDDETESCESDGDEHDEEAGDEEGHFQCPDCSDRLRSQ